MKNKNGRKVKRLRWNRTFVVLASVLVLAIGLVGTTLAWLSTDTTPITNTFTPSETTVTVDEEPGETKNNVKVTNTGDISAYIRATVVFTWQDKDGNVYAQAPVKEKDYTLTWTMEDWVESGNYYYYTKAVAAGASTGVLFTNCAPKAGQAPDGYQLCVEILAESIQADPASAVTEAWGVNPTTLSNNDGGISGN